MRYLVSWEADQKEFASYRSAFNFYMKLREGIGFEWLYVLDQKTGKYLICENCYAK
jgi:hypothetical protein